MSDEARKPAPEKGLSRRARKWWIEVFRDFDLERDEVELMVQICRTMTRADGLQAVLDAEGYTVLGSRDQTRIHPAVSALNATAALENRQVAQLNLPDQTDAPMATPAQTRARRAAEVRWRGHVPRDRRSA